MRCWISGERPEQPCVSRLSGHLFERRLAEKYVRATGNCPATGEKLTIDDLIDVIACVPPVLLFAFSLAVVVRSVHFFFFFFFTFSLHNSQSHTVPAHPRTHTQQARSRGRCKRRRCAGLRPGAARRPARRVGRRRPRGFLAALPPWRGTRGARPLALRARRGVQGHREARR
jgi:hypothetical protein